MSNNESFCLSFHRGDLRVWIRCSPMVSELTVSHPQQTAKRAYQLEILCQPKNETGWPVGQVHRLYETEIKMEFPDYSSEAHGHIRLPFRLGAETLKECYLRLIPCTMPSLDKIHPDRPT